MEHGLRCLRCGGEMRFACVEDLQLGKTSFLLGVWPNLLAGAMHDFDYPRCPFCGHEY